MPDGKVIVVGAIAAMLVVGGAKVVHGVKVIGKAIGHTAKHLVVHPVDSAKNGAAKK